MNEGGASLHAARDAGSDSHVAEERADGGHDRDERRRGVAEGLQEGCLLEHLVLVVAHFHHLRQ